MKQGDLTQFVRIAILFDLSCFICNGKYVFIRYKHENGRSVEQFAAGVGIHTKIRITMSLSV